MCVCGGGGGGECVCGGGGMCVCVRVCMCLHMCVSVCQCWCVRECRCVRGCAIFYLFVVSCLVWSVVCFCVATACVLISVRALVCLFV